MAIGDETQRRRAGCRIDATSGLFIKKLVNPNGIEIVLLFCRRVVNDLTLLAAMAV